MDMVSSMVFSMSVLAGVGALLGWHVRQWKTAQARVLEKAELDYRRSQFRRRMQTTMLFGLATASLPFGLPLIRAWPKAGAIYWGVIVLLLLWAIVLGLADILAIKVFYGRLQHRNQLERARLEVTVVDDPQAPDQRIALHYAHLPEAEITEGIRRLGHCLASYSELAARHAPGYPTMLLGT